MLTQYSLADKARKALDPVQSVDTVVDWLANEVMDSFEARGMQYPEPLISLSPMHGLSDTSYSVN